jgi:general secretion pathway protein F
MGILTAPVSIKHMVALTRTLAVSQAAGIDIVRAIELHRATRPGPAMSGLCTDAADRLRSGHTLAQAFSSRVGAFPPDFIAALAAGDRAGRLAEVFQHLEALYEERIALRRAIIRQLVYPLCVLIAAMYIIPAWAAAMQTNEDLGTFAKQYAWSLRWDVVYGVCTIGVGVVLFRLGIGRNVLAPALLFLWPFGSILGKLSMARVYQSAALLMQSGIPNAEAVALAAPTCGNRLMTHKFMRAVPALSAGTPFTEAIHAHVRIPALQLPILNAAEQSGTLDTMLATVARDLNQEARHPVLLFVSILELLVIVGLGLSFIPGFI